MKARYFSTMAVIMCILVNCPLLIQAKLIPIAINAEVTSVLENFDLLEGKIHVGDLVTGVYVYDSATPDRDPAYYHGEYEHHAPPAGITFTVGGFVFMTDPANVDFTIHIVDDPPAQGRVGDRYGILSENNLPLPNGTSVGGISLFLRNEAGGVLSSDALPTMAPVLDDWAQGGELAVSGIGRSFVIEGRLTSMALIPEPATLMFLGLGGLALLRNRRFH